VGVTEPQPRRRDEVAATADLGAHLVDVLSRPAQGTHRMIAGHVFRVLGPAAAPVRVVHDAIADASYAGVRSGARVVARVVGAGSSLLPPERTSHALTSTAAGSVVVGAVNGLFGDQLRHDGNHLAVQLGPHHQRRVVGAETALLARAHPEPTGHVVVFAHGLGETEQAWWYRHDGRGSHGQALAELGATPVVLRYNTGRPVADNGRELARLLADLLRAWPVPVERIDLVGHSMGGLVLREACSRAVAREWLPLVRTATYLGTPHDGAPLARGAARLATLLRWRPESRPWAEVLDLRSAGILDLERAHRLPLAPGVRHVAVAATLAADPSAWWAGAVGDGLVTVSSAKHTVPETHVVPATGHLALLTEPRVTQILAGLITWEPPAALAR
jgi:pimeloyl-ACP methyl ester carboxylesterase